MKKISLAFVAALGLMAFTSQAHRSTQTTDKGIATMKDTIPSSSNRQDSAGTLDNQGTLNNQGTVPPIQSTPSGNQPNNQLPESNQPGQLPPTSQPGTTNPSGNGSPTPSGSGQTAPGGAGSPSGTPSTGPTR